MICPKSVEDPAKVLSRKERRHVGRDAVATDAGASDGASAGSAAGGR